MNRIKILQEIIRCPTLNCWDHLYFNEKVNNFFCQNCLSVYDVHDGIPILMNDASKHKVRYWDAIDNAKSYAEKYDKYLKNLGSPWGQYKHNSEIYSVDRILKKNNFNLKGKIIADCGAGNARYLSLHPEAKLRIALDASINLLKLAKTKEPDFLYICCDVENLPLKDFVVDIAISIRVFQHLKEPEIAAREMVRIIKPEGLIAIQVYNKFNLKEIYKRIRMGILKSFFPWPLSYDRYFSFLEINKTVKKFHVKTIGWSGAGWGVHYYLFRFFFFKLSERLQKNILDFFFFLEKIIGENFIISKSLEMLTFVGTPTRKIKLNIIQKIYYFFRKKIMIINVFFLQKEIINNKKNNTLKDSLLENLNWIKLAQDVNPDDGISRGFSLIEINTEKTNSFGWQPSYPETSGYILPTLLECAEFFNDKDLFNRSRLLANFLLRVSDNGFVKGGHIYKKDNLSIFDTGQVMKGLLSYYTFSKNIIFLERAKECGDFILNNELKLNNVGLGRFSNELISTSIQFSNNDTFNIYIIQSLIYLSKILNNQDYARLAKRIIEYSLLSQNSNGYFYKNDFKSNTDSLTHNIGYVLEALIDAGVLLNDKKYINCVQISLDSIIEKLHNNGFLSSRFDENWNFVDAESSCLVGNSQIALTMIKLYKLNGINKYLGSSIKILNFIKKRSNNSINPISNLGSVYGSWPINGNYQSYQELNWAVKFMADCNLSLLKLKIDENKDFIFND
jgi:ubiquinone/menaquinone biosynthesis C-methylase UbiE/uncharacterized protein YbaR (Trm112 family)